MVLVLETPLIYLFGRDIFVSYARADAATYAQQLAIAVRGEVPKLSFFLDQWASMSGTTLPLSLRLALRWSQLLVFVGTQNAIDSAHVRMELQAFFNRRGRFVPIDVEGALRQAIGNDKFLSAVCGPGAVHETGTNVESGTPAKIVVTRIVEAVTFTRQDRRLRRAVFATTIGIVAIIATAFFASRSIISNAKAKAQAAEREAKDANDQRQRALEDLKLAQIATDRANGERTRAEQLAKQASEEAKLAESLRVEAEQIRDQARAEASRQSEISLMRQRGNQSELLLRRNPTRLADSVSLAIESMHRAQATGIYALEADRALRGSLALLPRSLGPEKTIEQVISVAAFSPDGTNVAVLAKTGAPDGASVLRILNGEGSREIGSFPREWRYVALSSDLSRVAIASGQTVQTREVSGDKRWQMPIENDDYVTGLALSPNGKYIVLIKKNSDYETRGFADVWEVETGNPVASLETDTLDMKSVAFSADGRFLAIGGGGFDPRGKRMGRVFVWHLYDHAIKGTLNKNHFERRDVMFQNEEIEAVAIGRDDRFVATASGQIAIVWKKTVGSYQAIARMPIERRIDELAFTPDGKYLHILSGGVCQDSTVECRRRFLETWESNGHWQALAVSHTDAIESLAFQSGDQFISTITSGYGDDNRHMWRAADGTEIKTVNERDEKNVSAKAASSDVHYVVTETEDALYVSDSRGVKIAVETTGVDENKFFNPHVTPDGSLLAFGGKKKGESEFSVFIYRPGNGSYVMDRSFRVAGYPASIAISPDRKYVAVSQSIDNNEQIKVIEIKNERDWTPAGSARLRHVVSFEFATDGKTLAVLSDERGKQSVSVWRLRDGKEIGLLQSTGAIPSYRFNAVGDQLAAAMERDTVELFDVRTGKITVLQMNSQIRVVAFSPDGQFLATADAKGLVMLFQLSNLDEVADLQHDNNVSQIVFSRDGKYLATASGAIDVDATPHDERNVLHLWLMHPNDLIKEACQRLTRFRTQPLSYCAMR